MEIQNSSNNSLPPPTGMTSITGQNLETLKSFYHECIDRAIHREGEPTLLFSHFGDFDPAKNETTLKMMESVILEAGDKRSMMKKVCGMLIEVLQNISIHGARERSGRMHAYLIISRSATGYLLNSGNLVLKEDIEPLAQRMEKLLAMSEDELRRQYIEILCNEEFSHKGGAGLGLLTIAKRSEQRIRYNVETLDKTFGYFQMEMTVPFE